MVFLEIPLFAFIMRLLLNRIGFKHLSCRVISSSSIFHLKLVKLQCEITMESACIYFLLLATLVNRM